MAQTGDTQNTGHHRTRVERFMDATGKLRAIFGPAQSSARDHQMTPENKLSLEQMQRAVEAQYETVRRPDGSTYIVPKQQ